MKLSILKHIQLVNEHPVLPDWLFSRDNVIMTQTIKLNEDHMKELLLFLEQYSSDFFSSDLTVNIAPFTDIVLEYK